MSAIVRGNVRMAISSIRNTRWRSFFTMFGVVVAIVPVLTILSIGEGVKRQITDQINGLGSNLLTVRPGQLVSNDSALKQFSALSGYTTAGTFTAKDFEAVRELKDVDKIAPLSIVPGAVKVDDKAVTDTFVVGTTEDLPSLIGQDVQHGGFFTDKEYGRRSVVIGRGAAEKIFGEGIPLGRAFDFRDDTFVVGGVLERSETAPLSFSTDLNNAIIMPYQLASSIAGEAPPIYEMLVRPSSEDKTEKLQADITKALAGTRGGEKDFSVVTQAENMQVVTRILTLVTALVSGVAGIALVVSGIGIMNIMLVSVTERLHEIGVRKAIGATRRQVIGQFMSEAIILSTSGGVIGVLLSFLAMYFVRLFTNIEAVITWEAVCLVVGTSLIVGTIFGSIPAIKAARKDPIEALRHQ